MRVRIEMNHHDFQNGGYMVMDILVSGYSPLLCGMVPLIIKVYLPTERFVYVI